MSHYQQAHVQQTYLVHTPAKAESSLNNDEATATAVWDIIRNFLFIDFTANFYNGSTAFHDTGMLMYCITRSSNIVIVDDEFNTDRQSKLILVARIVDRVSAKTTVEKMNLNLSIAKVPDVVHSRMQITSNQVVAVSRNACKAIGRLHAKHKPVQYQTNIPPSKVQTGYTYQKGDDELCLIVTGVIFLFIPFLFWIGVILICMGVNSKNK